MIGSLKGILDSTDEDSAVIDVNGVGYVVFAPQRTLATLAPGEAASLVIETHVREDHIHLYGFETKEERAWFRLLLTVQRVGARMALAILHALPPASLAHALITQDTRAFSRISGIGGKLAERIVTELKEKAASMPVGNGIALPASLTPSRTTITLAPDMEDAVSALQNLGFSRIEAARAVERVKAQNPEMEDGQLIRESLKQLSARSVA